MRHVGGGRTHIERLFGARTRYQQGAAPNKVKTPQGVFTLFINIGFRFGDYKKVSVDRMMGEVGFLIE